MLLDVYVHDQNSLKIFSSIFQNYVDLYIYTLSLVIIYIKNKLK